MIAGAASTCFAFRDLHPLTTGRLGVWFFGVFALYMISSFVTYVQSQKHEIFAATFLISTLVPLSLAFAVASSYSAKLGPVKNSGRKDLTRELVTGCLSSLFGYMIWYVDQRCVNEEWDQAFHSAYELRWYNWCHPLWHIFTAIGVESFSGFLLTARLMKNQHWKFHSPGQPMEQLGLGYPSEY
jgi:hypothetical protein